MTPKQELLDLPPWPFAELAESWGGVGIRVTTPNELNAALCEAHQTEGFVIIECIVPRGRQLADESSLHPAECSEGKQLAG